MTARIVVVSNRVAPIDEGRTAAGGLAVAVLAALRRSGGIWFGWSGEVVAAPGEAVHLAERGRLATATVDLGEADFEAYYNGFANATLWPLFHYRVDLVDFERANYAGYRRVNADFARKLARLLRPDDVIWAHDYHLIPLGEELRRLGVGNRIGFFLHTPLPPRELLATLPVHAELMRCLAFFDLIGLQTERDRARLCGYLAGEADASVEEGGGGATVRAFGREFRIEAHPIGIDTAHVEQAAAGTAGMREVERLRVSLADRRLIVGVDRLDYSKGLPQRFDAFAHLLRAYPGNRNRVSLMQIAPPTRGGVAEYSEIRRTLDTLAGHVNGEFADVDWVPIRYLNRSFSRRTLFGFLRLARVGLVTPLRDGMNLVAMEYLAAQPPDDPGALVLSRFAGAAQYLPDALIVNPYDVEGVAEAIQAALAMPLGERRERWERSMRALRSNSVEAWYERFLARLAGG
ncbi:MAG: trehalose-6-phosphate synthase [Defluviicoccus sp.]|nr:trehalose-6-phosphate synthase [Defluviicoccus sp.]MDE0387029.1 trehalose-6-phosphate synthase [Defluviicoccus sp.]